VINPSAAWERIKGLPMFARMKLSDFRPIVFPLVQTAVASLNSVGPLRRDFPGGAIILGVTGSAIQNGAAFAPGGTTGRQAFSATMAYTNDEQIVPSDLLMCESLLGTAAECEFPPREIVVAPTQGINVQLRNLTTTVIDIHLGFHCLVWRFAS
jgi:hypothetical protein